MTFALAAPKAAPAGTGAAFASQPWIGSARFDIPLIILPGLIVMLISLFIPQGDLAPWQWGLAIMMIDVGHVYTSVFRTYFDKEELRARMRLYIYTPVVCWTIGVFLYSIGPALFWGWVAYFNAYHFLRQQYGFTMIYGRFERGLPGWCRWIDKAAVYCAMLYPLIVWHFGDAVQHHWIVKGDFIDLGKSRLIVILDDIVALSILAAWIGKEIYLRRLGLPFNVPRAGLLAVTAVIGLAPMDTVVAYSAAIAVAHSLPYAALTFLYERKRVAFGVSPYKGLFKHMLPAVLAFAGVILFFVFFEEMMWDWLVWREDESFFPIYDWMKALVHEPPIHLIAPLLALPQLMHYVYDAVLWKRNLPHSNWPKILFGKPA